MFILALLLVGCSAENLCKKPMVQIKDKCCVDLDENQICDIEETKEMEKPEVQETKNTESETVEEEIPEEKPVITVESKTTKTEITEKPKEEPTNQITGEATAEEPIVKVEKSEEKMSDTETYQFIEMYEANDLGYQYIYNHNWHRMKDNKIKIELSATKKFYNVRIEGKKYPVFHIDRIYIDRNKQEATGYCEKDVNCFAEELTDIPLKLDYAEFNEKTPEDWLYEYGEKQPDLFEERKYYLKSQLTTRAIYQTATGEIRLYYDPKIGLPLRIEEKIEDHPTKITEYFELTAGTVRDVDVIHRNRDEIPPEDVFYTTRS
ncbi:hypothetical protein GF358_01120 [Candidatus Woesearchaeota archaeon]|nr:hypothetical protein [Candidatus Woesearchaeota archaeon]